MNYLSMMNEDEIKYVCSVIPLSDSVRYFRLHPKDFAKVKPGFRATSFKNQEQISEVLFHNRNKHFISNFIEKHISQWLDEIDAAVKEKIDNDESKNLVLLHTLPYCPFADNIELYFKFTKDVYTKEFLSLFSESVKTIKEAAEEREQIKNELNSKNGEVDRLKSDVLQLQTEQCRTNKKMRERLDEIKMLKRTNADLEKSKMEIDLLEQTIARLKKNAQERDNYIQQLKTELSSVKKAQPRLEKEIREKFIKQQETESHCQDATKKPKCPKDLDEFREYLGYNFENIGMPTNGDYFPLIVDHLSEILFQGKPIIISRTTGLSLMKCVSNALVKTSEVSILVFTSKITEKTIDNFLSQDKRLLCLDNFIGNYNETILMPIFEMHRDKIIFLTVTYDRTLAFVPDEIMRYCHYLNLNRIEACSTGRELTEDPSVVDEDIIEITPVNKDIRWLSVLKKILEELGCSGALSSYKELIVTNELSLCRLLAFDVLPYCTDVLKISPFNVSDWLIKYAGGSGRCPYKELFKRWFA